MRVPLLDLSGQYGSIKDEIDEAIQRVVRGQRFILGPEVEGFEEDLAGYCGCDYAVGVSSGTDALLVSLMALGIGPGDEVVTTPFTFFATVGAILRVGAVPVFADIDQKTFNIDPELVTKALTARAKAIIPVHLFGQCVDMEPILDMAREKGLAVIEDAAQAIGAGSKNRRAGSMGTVGCFSFFPSKNLGCFGDGGMVTTNDGDLAEKLKVFRNQGAEPKYYHSVVGGNFRLDALQAAILRVKLRHLDLWTEGRRANAAYYTRRFRELGVDGECVVCPRVVHERHVYNQYVIRARNRDGLKAFLQEHGITTEIYYPLGLHLQECVRNGRFKEGDFPVTEEATWSVLALPIYPELTVEQLEYVVSAVGRFYGCYDGGWLWDSGARHI